MTLNQIFDQLKKFAENHVQVNEFGKGPTDDITVKKEHLYPAMWIALLPSTYSGSEKSMNHRMAVIFYDRLMDGKENELDVQNDMLLVGLDFLAHVNDNPDLAFYISGDASINYFTENFTDWCAGVEITLTIKDPKPLDRCVIPFSY